jgi:hypothetical protein
MTTESGPINKEKNHGWNYKNSRFKRTLQWAQQ